MKYQHIIFDLDHTLWDFDRNAQRVLDTLYQVHFADEKVFDELAFNRTYQKINKQLWQDYHAHRIDKATLRAERFALTFQELGVDPQLMPISSIELDRQFVEGTAKMDGVFPHCHRVLDALSEHFRLHIMTNGFVEVQQRKLASAKLDGYFDHLFISETIGANKPAPEIFQHAMNVLGAEFDQCLMVGDNLEADVGGAQGVGMDQVWFNPAQEQIKHNATYEVHCLSELPSILLPEYSF